MMNKIKISRSSVFVVALLGTVGTSWAALTACGTAPGTTLATLTGTTGETPTGGCGQTDLGFNAFTTPATTGTNSGPTSSQIELSTSGGTNNGKTITPIAALFTLTGGNSLSSGTSTIISSFADLGAPVGGQSPPSNSPAVWEVSGLGLSFAAETSGNPAHAETVQVQEAFCIAQSTFTCLATAKNYGYLQITETIATSGAVSYSDVLCTPGSGGCTITNATTSSLAITFSNPYNAQVATQLSFDISRQTGSGNTLTLDSISETWSQVESPEPSTWLLFGSALAALSAIRGTRRS